MSPQYSHRSCRHGPQGGVGFSVSATTTMRVKTAWPSGERLDERDAFGAERQAVGRILDVAAGHDVAVARLERGAYLEAGVTGVRARARERRGRDERLGEVGFGGDRDLERHGPPRRVVSTIAAGAAFVAPHGSRRSHLEVLGAGPARSGTGRSTRRSVVTPALDRGPDGLGGRRLSESLNDALQQRAELAANATRDLHHLVVDERLRQDAGRHVGDARDAEHLDAHVSRDDGFGRGRHPDGVSADRPQVADFCRRFVARSVQRGIDAVRERQPARARGVARELRAGASNRPPTCPGNRGPKRSSLAPTSGLLPIRLM